MKSLLRIPFAIAVIFLATGRTAHAELDLEGIFDASSSGFMDSVYRSTDWGWLSFAESPWINTICLGWIYLDETSTPEDYFFWHESLGWAYSSASTFPEVYLFEGVFDRRIGGATGTWLSYDGGWVILDLNDATIVRYYHLGVREWYSISRTGISHNYGLSSVPSGLQDISAVNWRTQDLLVGSIFNVGSDSLTIMHDATHMGIKQVDEYSYNEQDGRFYPVTNYVLDYYGQNYPSQHHQSLTAFPYWTIQNIQETDGKVTYERTNLLTGETESREF